MRPVDPRLLRYAARTRVFLAATAALGLAGAALVVAQAALVAGIVSGAFAGRGAAAAAPALGLLAAVSAGRGAVAWLTELAAHRTSASVKSALRLRLVRHAARCAPGRGTGDLTTLAVRGIDALDDYFARYLPQLALAVVVPAVVLARIATADAESALVIALTLPLIPVFMALIGWYTEARGRRQWLLLARLSGHFLDVVAGMPTLKVFGRAKAQAANVRRITDGHRRAVLGTLRVAFLSSFALELLSTLSVALVAVGIGFRLVGGGLDLRTGLMVLVLAPEAYLPLRQVGTHYHAAAEGLAAADEVFAVLETAPPVTGSLPVPGPDAVLAVEGLAVRHPGRTADAPARVTFTVSPGETVALTGPSGAGKSTVLAALLGLLPPSRGRVTVGGTDLALLERDAWWERIAWLPQRPHLFDGTVAQNVRLARPAATDAQLRRALRDAGALGFVTALPQGTDTRLGEGGAGLSAGQRQRLALARVFLADRPVLLLDEPTAGLDNRTEAHVAAALRRLARDRTVVVVAHRPALLAVADRVVHLGLPAAERAGAARESPTAVPPERRRPATGPAAVPQASAGTGAGEPPPGAAGGGSPLRWLARDGSAVRGRFALAAVLGALALVSAAGLLGVSGWLISRAAQHPPVLTLMVATTATRAFGLGRAVLRYAERLVAHDAVLRALGGLRAAVVARLARLAPGAGPAAHRGDLLSRLVCDVDAAQDHLLRWVLPVASAVPAALAAAAFTGLLLPRDGLLLAGGLLAAGAGVPWLAAALSRRAESRIAPARGELSARVVDVLSGTAELAVAGALPGRLEAVARADRELTGLAARSAASAGLGSGLTVLLTGLTATACAATGVAAVAAGRLPAVALAVVVLLPLAAFESVAGLPAAVRYRRRGLRAAARVAEVLTAPEPVREPAVPAAPPATPFPLRLTGLTVRHPGAVRPALDGFRLELAQGDRVAVVGASGAGKTTLAHALLRFVEPESGGYLLAGTPAGTLDGDAVRRFVGLCAQDAHVFDSSLRENLRLARPGATDAELRQALGRARLLGWVEALPGGLDTLVGEHGARLSGGQRQRLALARALLADFPVLVLDEPAEHLDLPTADALTADLLAATRGRTTVLITHRLACLARPGAVDAIVVLDAGRSVQRGTFAELAAAQGPFRDLLLREREADAGPAVPAGAAAGAPG